MCFVLVCAGALALVRVSIFHSNFAEPASLTLFGIGLSLVAVQCRATRERNLVRVGQFTSRVPSGARWPARDFSSCYASLDVL